MPSVRIASQRLRRDNGTDYLRKIIRRALLAFLALLLAAAIGLGYEADAIYNDASQTYSKQPRLTSEPNATPVTDFFGNHRINFLLLGSDNDRKSQERRPLTQSMIVVSVDPVHDHVNILSIPRDFWINIPGHGMGKIDLAAKYGGISLARDTVEHLFHINIDYYAWVGLSGFSAIVNDFGGVTINVTHPILDDFYPNDQTSVDPYAYTRIFIPPGWRHLSGRQALQYVRSRHGDAVGDFGRSDRQQQVLLQLRKKANGLDLILKIPQLAHDLRNVVRTDVGTSKLLDVARLARHITPSDITRTVLSAPTYCRYAFAGGGQSVLIPNWKAIRPVVRQIFAPIQVPPTSTPAPSPSPAPARTARPETAPTLGPSPTSAPPAAPTPTPLPPTLNQLPANLIYTAGGTFYEMDRHRHTAGLMPSWMTAADMPALSPDGKTVVFMRWSTYASDLYSYNLRTHAVPTQITHDASPNPQQVWNYMWAAWPAFSPDGRTILFSHDRYKLTSAASESRKLDLAIYAMNPDGSNLRQITVPATGAGGDTDAQFVGHSSRFLYDHWAYHMQATSSGELAVGQPYSQLMITDLNNPNTSWTLTPPSGQIVQPTVDRRGDRVAYIRAHGSISQLVVARLVTTKKGPQLRGERVIASGEIAQPALTPGGHWIAYLQADGDGFSIYVERSSGGPAIKLSEAGTGVDALSRPIWVP